MLATIDEATNENKMLGAFFVLVRVRHTYTNSIAAYNKIANHPLLCTEPTINVYYLCVHKSCLQANEMRNHVLGP